MKIDPYSKISTSQLRKKKAASGSSGGSGFASALEGEIGQGNEISTTAPAAGLGSLLAVQEVSDEGERRRQAVQQGQTLLDHLDEIRFALLGGGLSVNQIENLARLVEERRPDIEDSELNDVLDDIELRVAVELAKFSR